MEDMPRLFNQVIYIYIFYFTWLTQFENLFQNTFHRSSFRLSLYVLDDMYKRWVYCGDINQTTAMFAVSALPLNNNIYNV